jgi:hypothetical protein
MKYQLIINFDVPEKIVTWDMHAGEHEIWHFLPLCLSDLEGAKIEAFSCTRTDGSYISGALDRCETVCVLSTMQSGD